MPRVPPNSKVRRCLFPDVNIEEQARIDNFANILQESAARDRQEKSKKWNFDFANEVPLDGPYEWYKREGDEWTRMKIKTEDLKASEKDKTLPKKIENENTPVHVRDESVPIIRKRRKATENKTGNQAVKRKVDFDQCSFLRRSDY